MDLEWATLEDIEKELCNRDLPFVLIIKDASETWQVASKHVDSFQALCIAHNITHRALLYMEENGNKT